MASFDLAEGEDTDPAWYDTFYGKVEWLATRPRGAGESVGNPSRGGSAPIVLYNPHQGELLTPNAV